MENITTHKEETLKRSFSSNESIPCSDDQPNVKLAVDCCKGCKKPYSRLYFHLTRSSKCSLHYDMVAMKEELDNQKRMQDKVRKQNSRKRLQEQDPQAYQHKRKSEKQQERAKEMKDDPDKFREKEAKGRQSRSREGAVHSCS